MPASEPRRLLDETGRLGDELIDRLVKPALRPEDHGKFIAIDVDTGDYEVDEDDYAALSRLRARISPTAEVWLARAGYPTAYKMRRGR